jgi:P-type E1-E2 ATPase
LVGDIVKIVEGMNIPCDGFVLSGIEVKTDESAMTGETDLIKKATLKQCLEVKENSRLDHSEGPQNHRVPSPCLLSGTKIINGEG